MLTTSTSKERKMVVSEGIKNKSSHVASTEGILAFLHSEVSRQRRSDRRHSLSISLQDMKEAEVLHFLKKIVKMNDIWNRQ